MESVRVILEALQSGDSALATRTVDQELKKSPQSDVYLSLKVHVAHTLLDKRASIKAAEEAVKVCSKKTLEMFIVPALADYNRSDLLQQAFQRVDRLAPSDKDVREFWLETALYLGDLNSAQKALMALNRDTKTPRSSAFECCIVMAEIRPVNKLFPLLAQRMLANFMPVKSPQECFVVAKVKKLESDAKMVEYLQDKELLPFLAGSLELQLLLLDGLLALEKWEDLQAYATQQLEKIDSYNYWEALNTAAVKLGTTDKVREFRSKFKGLNAALAGVDLAVKTNTDVAESVLTYWKQFGANASTPQFLAPYLNSELVDLIKEREPATKLGEKINLLKLQTKFSTAPSTSDLLKLYEEHESEAPAEKTEYFIGTDALLMAALNLIKGGSDSNGESNKAGAIAVLEYALKLDPHQFYVRLMLIELYNSLGATLLAKPHFDALSIKNIQYETLGFLLTTRGGSVSPKDSKPLLARLEAVRRNIPPIGEYAAASLRRAHAYTQFLGVFELGVKMKFSLGTALQLIELAKSSRIERGKADLTDLAHICGQESELQDSRDFSTRFMNEELKQLYVGPKQGAEYVSVYRTKELAQLEFNRNGALSEETRAEVSKLSERAKQSSEFTKEEIYNIEVVSSMLLQQQTSDITVPTFDVSQPLDWRFYHWAYTLLETAKNAKQLKAAAPKVNNLVREATQHYLNSLVDLERNFVAKVRKDDLPGDASKPARQLRNEHSRKLQDLQALLN